MDESNQNSVVFFSLYKIVKEIMKNVSKHGHVLVTVGNVPRMTSRIPKLHGVYKYFFLNRYIVYAWVIPGKTNVSQSNQGEVS